MWTRPKLIQFLSFVYVNATRTVWVRKIIPTHILPIVNPIHCSNIDDFFANTHVPGKLSNSDNYLYI